MVVWSTVAQGLLAAPVHLHLPLQGIDRNTQGRVVPPHKTKAKGPAPNGFPCLFWEAETTCCKEAENDTSFLGNGHDLKEACGNYSSSLSFAHKTTKRQQREGTTPLVLARRKTDKRITSVCLPRGNKPQVIPYGVTPVNVGGRQGNTPKSFPNNLCVY